MSKKTKIELGSRYRDKVSGWEGVAAARYEYMNGCVRIELGGSDDKGQPKAFVFDEGQIEAVAAKRVEVLRRRTGGPQTDTPVAR